MGGELPLAELQDPEDIELHRVSPLLLSGKECCNQILLLRALSLHSFPLIPISAVTFLNSMEVSLGAIGIAIEHFLIVSVKCFY